MTGLGTITGGLAAVIYTETLQSVIMIGGGLTLMGFAFHEVGGYQNLYIKYMNSVPAKLTRDTIYLTNTSLISEVDRCGLPNKNAFQMLRHISDNDMPWLGFLLGQTPSSIWYWCSE